MSETPRQPVGVHVTDPRPHQDTDPRSEKTDRQRADDNNEYKDVSDRHSLKEMIHRICYTTEAPSSQSQCVCGVKSFWFTKFCYFLMRTLSSACSVSHLKKSARLRG